MKVIRLALALSFAAFIPSDLAAQALTCTAGSGVAAQNCTVFHYHVQVWKPDTKTFTELYATPQFASINSCEAAKNAHQNRNKAMVDQIKRTEPKAVYELNRYGPCHCDLTHDKTNPFYLDDDARVRQLKTAEEINSKIRERLADFNIKSDSDHVRFLSAPPPNYGASLWSKNVTMPEIGGSTIVETTNESDLKDSVIETEAAAAGSMDTDLPLVDVSIAVVPRSTPASTASRPAPRPPQVASSVTEVPAEGAPAEETTSEAEPEEEPAEEAAAESSPEPTVPTIATTAMDEDTTTAVDRLISYETARVQNVLKANASVTDETLRKRIFESSMQRLQLLSNLRTIIEASGARSQLASLARNAKDEASRMTLATRLFGEQLRKHWAPTDAKEIILETPTEVADDPIAVLRDTSGRFTSEQRRLALYLVLARNSSLTSNQELWISGLIESFLAQ